MECLGKYGLDTYDMVEPEKQLGSEDPVKYYDKYVKFLRCYVEESYALKPNADYDSNTQNLSDNGYVMDFSRRIGYDFTKTCLKPKEEICYEDFKACNIDCDYDLDNFGPCQTSCFYDYRDCRTNVYRMCEEDLYQVIENYARTVKQTDADIPQGDPEDYAFCLPPGSPIDSGGGPKGFLHPTEVHAQISSNYSIVTRIEGEVLIKTKNATQWAPAFKGQRLMVGDKIKTGRSGRAEVKFANSAIFRMRPYSEMWIPDQAATECRLDHRVGFLDMKFGKVWSAVTGKPSVKVKTPNAVIGTVRKHDPMQGDAGGSGDALGEYVEVPFAGVAYVGGVAHAANIAHAAGDEIIVHSYHDETTGVSKFAVENGAVDVMNLSESGAVELTSGEHLTVNSGENPDGDNVENFADVSDAWWEDDYNWGGLPNYVYFIAGLVLVGGLVFVVKRVVKRRG